MGFLSKIRKGMKKQIAQMPRGVARDMGPGNIPRRSGGLFRGLPMAKPIMGDMRFRGSMPSIIEGRAERLPTAPSGIAGLMDRLKNISMFGQKMPQPMPGAMPQVDMQNIPQIPTRESIQNYVRENIDLSNLQSRMPNFQMFQEGGFVGTIGNIPSLKNIDFSNLPMGMDFTKFDPRAINANPTGFQDMIERARAQEQIISPVDEFGMQGKPSSFSNLEISDEALRLAEQYNPKAMSGTPAQRQSALEMIQATLNAGEGEQGVQNLYANNIQAFKPGMQTGGNDPFVSGATRIEAGLDPLSRQLLFGLDGRGGFIPGAFRAAERTFFTPEGEARVIPEEIAGLTPDQLRAMEIARQTGVQDPYLQQSRQAYERGLGALGQGFGRAEAEQRRAVQDVLGGVSQAEALRGRGLAGLTGALGEAGQIARGATGIFGAGLRDPESLFRGTLGGYDPRMTEQFYDPFEERVVQQTVRDVLERGEQADIAARAADIGRGGESAFGSRARLMAGERERALGRGLGEAISGIRSAGFQRAQQAGMGEFGRQLEARRQAASGLAGLAGQRLGAQQTLGQTLAGLGSTQQQALSQAGQQALGAQQALAGARSGLAGLQQQMAGQQQAAQFGAGQALAGLGTQAQMAQQADISQLLGVGAQQQQQQQAVLDAQRRAALQAQQAPLAQYQSLLPFVQAVPAGQQQVTTTFAPPPSPLQAGLGVGLSTLGALGQFMNQPQQQQFYPSTRTI